MYEYVLESSSSLISLKLLITQSKFIFVNDELAGTFFFVRFFYKINKNWTVSKDLNCYIIFAAIMNEFPKRSRAVISK
jgi:hypothetical protein